MHGESIGDARIVTCGQLASGMCFKQSYKKADQWWWQDSTPHLSIFEIELIVSDLSDPIDWAPQRVRKFSSWNRSRYRMYYCSVPVKKHPVTECEKRQPFQKNEWSPRCFIALIKNQSDSNDYLWALATRVSTRSFQPKNTILMEMKSRAVLILNPIFARIQNSMTWAFWILALCSFFQFDLSKFDSLFSLHLWHLTFEQGGKLVCPLKSGHLSSHNHPHPPAYIGISPASR